MILEPITERMSLVRGEGEGRLPYSFSVLIVDDEVVLIDTGCGIEHLRQLRQEYDVARVINSHSHPDHSAGNWVFEGRPIQVPDEGFDSNGDVVALSGRFVSRELARFFQGFARETTGFRDCRPTDSYNEATVFCFGKTILRPIHTPGHSKDHYCLYEPEEGILFSFDYDLTPIPWYGHRESNLQQFRESVRKLRELSPKVVVSAHRGIVTESIDAEFDRFMASLDERDERILSLLESGKTVDELVECAPIYGSFPYAEPLLRYWEGQMIEKHLEQMEVEGRVLRNGNAYARC